MHTVKSPYQYLLITPCQLNLSLSSHYSLSINSIDPLSTSFCPLFSLTPTAGKTTQIPQFLHEAAGGRAKIVVCQPRRLAAVGVATRVAEELGRPSCQ